VVWYSEPYDLGAFDLARGFLPVETRVRMIRPVKGGIFFGDELRTYFAAGADPRAMDLITVAESPVIEGTDARLQMKDFGDGSMSGIGAIWTARDGVYVGTPDGQAINLTHRKTDFPAAVRGAGVVISGRYVATLEP
jgi:hypothetical protein